MCAVTYLFEMDVSKTRLLWTPRQLGEWDSFLLEHLHHQHICLVWEACLLGCMRGCVCVWVCERMCGVGEVCVGVWAGVRGCEWCVWGRGSRDRQSTLTSLGSCTPFLLVNDPGRCDLTACDKKICKNAWATYSSNQRPPLPANPRSLLEVTSSNIYMSGAKTAFWRQQSTLYQLI